MLVVKRPFERIDEDAKRREGEEDDEKLEQTSSDSYRGGNHGGEEAAASLPYTSPAQRGGGQQGGEGREERERENMVEGGGTGEGTEETGETTAEETSGGGRGDEEGAGGNGGDSGDDAGDNNGDDNMDEGGEGEEGVGEEEGGADGEESSDDSFGEGWGEQGGAGEYEYYEYNTRQAFDILQAVNVKQYQTQFYMLLELLAEEKLKLYDPRSADEYNIYKMLLRRYEGRPPSYYRQSRVRDRIVLVLDDSGSMTWWAQNIAILAQLALTRDDINIFIAPNGHFEEMLTKRGPIPVSHSAVMRSLAGRKVLYVGDYDGADTPILLSMRNQVIWICPEARYRRFRSHDWVHYDESDYRGAFLRVYNLDEMFYALRKLLSYQYVSRVWIDLHQDDRFIDDHDKGGGR